MQAIVASTVKHTTTSTSIAAISTRPARAAATAARSALTAKDRSRSPSSSLSPVPPSPQDNVYDLAAEAPGSPGDVAGTSKGEQVKVEDDEVEEPKPKKKRTRKPKEPVVYDIPPVEQLTTTFKGRLGYACLNTILRKQKPPVFCSRTCRLDTVAKEDKGVPYLKELTRQNIKDLKTIIEWNAAHDIFFMRMSSDIAPFASHPDLQYSLDYVSEELKEAGDTANRLGVRITSHPGQYCQIASPRQVVVENAYRDLEYHNELMDRMGLGKDSVMIIHGGGVFGDKEATLKRFRENYKELSQGVKNRLVLENDEICYNCDDLLPVCEELNIPLVFDYHHDWIYPSKQPPSELIPRILKLWERKGIKPKFHLSEPRKGAETIMEKRAHADRCQRLPEVLPDDMDLMIEAKDKEQAVFHLYRIYNLHPVIHEDLRPPALEETKQTAGRKSHKPKKGKKGAATDEDGTDGTAGTATDGTAGEGDEEQTEQVVHALVDGEMPLPEGKDAEGQAYDPPLKEKKKRTPRKKVAEQVKEEDGAAADGATSPAKKRGGAGTKRKSKAAEETAHLDGEGVEADGVEPPAAKKARTPKKASPKRTTEDATA
ncbi:uncharacterized protein JCM10292_007113 [Rhodotorula paludigena]|uniref:uncharacterized protein n=1 Tax=Rhodotorula paludigena TaxID=86838 RepID=UPI00316C9F4D